MEFQARKVYYQNGYPCVWWPNHPVAHPSGGTAAIHRVVAYEEWGPVVLTNIVHHKDGNLDNWAIENLEVLSQDVHARIHKRDIFPVRGRTCQTCWAPFIRNRGKFCCRSCFEASRRIFWPTMEELRAKVERSSYAAVGRCLGVSGMAVKKRLNTRP